MEVHFTPETELRLQDLSEKTGRATGDLVEDALAGYLEELADARDLLDRRYDEIKRGLVKPIDGDEAFGRLRRKSEERRANRP
jgi:predicted DNA-binding protein